MAFLSGHRLAAGLDKDGMREVDNLKVDKAPLSIFANLKGKTRDLGDRIKEGLEEDGEGYDDYAGLDDDDD